MMANKIVTVNATTGEETVRDLTADEIAQFEADKRRWAELRAEEEAAAEKTAADKESGNQKLKDLGLTDDEIAAITS
tara:strand:+ start:199 stop:429 length:231 start_codon:yes stop_codon:yes gene_type:complete